MLPIQGPGCQGNTLRGSLVSSPITRVARSLLGAPPLRKSSRRHLVPERFKPGMDNSCRTPKKKASSATQKSASPSTPSKSPRPIHDQAAWSVKKAGKRVLIGPSPKSSRLKNVIYTISRKDKHDLYVGSAVHLGKRFSQYRYQINGKGARHIERAVRRSPEKFKLKVVKQLSDKSNRLELLKAEKEHIENFKPRYNHGDINAEIAREKAKKA